jgi:hypothetical protein
LAFCRGAVEQAVDVVIALGVAVADAGAALQDVVEQQLTQQAGFSAEETSTLPISRATSRSSLVRKNHRSPLRLTRRCCSRRARLSWILRLRASLSVSIRSTHSVARLSTLGLTMSPM